MNIEHFKKRLIQQHQKPDKHSPPKLVKEDLDDDASSNSSASSGSNGQKQEKKKEGVVQSKVARKRAVCRSKFRHDSLKIFKLGTSIPTSLCKSKEPYNVSTEKNLQLCCEDKKPQQVNKKEEEIVQKESITEQIIHSIEGNNKKDTLHRSNTNFEIKSSKFAGKHSLPAIIPEIPVKRRRNSLSRSSEDEQKISGIPLISNKQTDPFKSDVKAKLISFRRKTTVGAEIYKEETIQIATNHQNSDSTEIDPKPQLPDQNKLDRIERISPDSTSTLETVKLMPQKIPNSYFTPAYESVSSIIPAAMNIALPRNTSITPVITAKEKEQEYIPRNTTSPHREVPYLNRELPYSINAISYSNRERSYLSKDLSYGNKELLYVNREASYANRELPYANREMFLPNSEMPFSNRETTWFTREPLYSAHTSLPPRQRPVHSSLRSLLDYSKASDPQRYVSSVLSKDTGATRNSEIFSHKKSKSLDYSREFSPVDNPINLSVKEGKDLEMNHKNTTVYEKYNHIIKSRHISNVNNIPVSVDSRINVFQHIPVPPDSLLNGIRNSMIPMTLPQIKIEISRLLNANVAENSQELSKYPKPTEMEIIYAAINMVYSTMQEGFSTDNLLILGYFYRRMILINKLLNPPADLRYYLEDIVNEILSYVATNLFDKHRTDPIIRQYTKKILEYEIHLCSPLMIDIFSIIRKKCFDQDWMRSFFLLLSTESEDSDISKVSGHNSEIKDVPISHPTINHETHQVSAFRNPSDKNQKSYMPGKRSYKPRGPQAKRKSIQGDTSNLNEILSYDRGLLTSGNYPTDSRYIPPKVDLTQFSPKLNRDIQRQMYYNLLQLDSYPPTIPNHHLNNHIEPHIPHSKTVNIDHDLNQAVTARTTNREDSSLELRMSKRINKDKYLPQPRTIYPDTSLRTEKTMNMHKTLGLITKENLNNANISLSLIPHESITDADTFLSSASQEGTAHIDTDNKTIQPKKIINRNTDLKIAPQGRTVYTDTNPVLLNKIAVPQECAVNTDIGLNKTPLERRVNGSHNILPSAGITIGLNTILISQIEKDAHASLVSQGKIVDNNTGLSRVQNGGITNSETVSKRESQEIIVNKDTNLKTIPQKNLVPEVSTIDKTTCSSKVQQSNMVITNVNSKSELEANQDNNVTIIPQVDLVDKGVSLNVVPQERKINEEESGSNNVPDEKTVDKDATSNAELQEKIDNKNIVSNENSFDNERVIIQDKSMEVTKGDRQSVSQTEISNEPIQNNVVVEKVEVVEKSNVIIKREDFKYPKDTKNYISGGDLTLFKEILRREDKEVYNKVLKKLIGVKETRAVQEVITIEDEEDSSSKAETQKLKPEAFILQPSPIPNSQEIVVIEDDTPITQKQKGNKEKPDHNQNYVNKQHLEKMKNVEMKERAPQNNVNDKTGGQIPKLLKTSLEKRVDVPNVTGKKTENNVMTDSSKLRSPVSSIDAKVTEIVNRNEKLVTKEAKTIEHVEVLIPKQAVDGKMEGVKLKIPITDTNTETQRSPGNVQGLKLKIPPAIEQHVKAKSSRVVQSTTPSTPVVEDISSEEEGKRSFSRPLDYYQQYSKDLEYYVNVGNVSAFELTGGKKIFSNTGKRQDFIYTMPVGPSTRRREQFSAFAQLEDTLNCNVKVNIEQPAYGYGSSFFPLETKGPPKNCKTPERVSPIVIQSPVELTPPLAPLSGVELLAKSEAIWKNWITEERNKGFLDARRSSDRRQSIETISSVGSDYSPSIDYDENYVKIRIDTKWYRVNKTVMEHVPKGKMTYDREKNYLIRYFDDNQLEQFIKNVNMNLTVASDYLKHIKDRVGGYLSDNIFLTPFEIPENNEVIQLSSEISFTKDDNISDPERYVEEVEKVERFVPKDFLGFYKYVTGYQIVHHHDPISFQTFLTMHNTNRIKSFFKKYLLSVLEHK